VASAAERDIVRDIKETLCYVAEDCKHKKGIAENYELPDGEVRSPQLDWAPAVLGHPCVAACTYQKNTNSSANLPTPMYWHKVLHQYLSANTCNRKNSPKN
jgi:Actin